MSLTKDQKLILVALSIVIIIVIIFWFIAAHKNKISQPLGPTTNGGSPGPQGHHTIYSTGSVPQVVVDGSILPSAITMNSMVGCLYVLTNDIDAGMQVLTAGGTVSAAAVYNPQNQCSKFITSANKYLYFDNYSGTYPTNVVVSKALVNDFTKPTTVSNQFVKAIIDTNSSNTDVKCITIGNSKNQFAMLDTNNNLYLLDSEEKLFAPSYLATYYTAVAPTGSFWFLSVTFIYNPQIDLYGTGIGTLLGLGNDNNIYIISYNKVYANNNVSYSTPTTIYKVAISNQPAKCTSIYYDKNALVLYCIYMDASGNSNIATASNLPAAIADTVAMLTSASAITWNTSLWNNTLATPAISPIVQMCIHNVLPNYSPSSLELYTDASLVFMAPEFTPTILADLAFYRNGATADTNVYFISSASANLYQLQLAKPANTWTLLYPRFAYYSSIEYSSVGYAANNIVTYVNNIVYTGNMTMSNNTFYFMNNTETAIITPTTANRIAIEGATVSKPLSAPVSIYADITCADPHSQAAGLLLNGKLVFTNGIDDLLTSRMYTDYNANSSNLTMYGTYTTSPAIVAIKYVVPPLTVPSMNKYNVCGMLIGMDTNGVLYVITPTYDGTGKVTSISQKALNIAMPNALLLLLAGITYTSSLYIDCRNTVTIYSIWCTKNAYTIKTYMMYAAGAPSCITAILKNSDYSQQLVWTPITVPAGVTFVSIGLSNTSYVDSIVP